MERNVTISNESGLHARPASLFVNKANTFKSEINVEVNGKRTNAKSILGLLSLAIPQGQTLKIIAEGVDEEAALESLCSLVESGL